MPVRYGFRRFGDDDDFNDLDVEEMLRMLADDFMENGDLEEAMDRLLREGYTTADGERIEGLRDLLEQARAKRRELEQQADPDGEMQRYRDWLDDIEATEDAELDDTPRRRREPPTTNVARRSRATSSIRRRCSAT